MNAIDPSEAERRLGLAPGDFPFASRFLDASGARLHFIDEGEGPTLLMIHGNPTWSRLFRDVVLALRDEFRCVALDLPGFGLSSPPPGFSFRPEDHAPIVADFLEKLGLVNATLVAHDWGGPIGLAAARATSGRVTRLCLGNTWAWSVAGDFHFEWFSRALGGPLGGFAAERFLVFVNFIMPSFMQRRKMTSAELRAFRAPFQGLQARRATRVFPQAITASGAWLGGLEAFVRDFDGPTHFIWPDADIAFRDKELARWRGLTPRSGVTRLEHCGHYLWLEAPEECAGAVRAFMRG